MGLVVIVEGLIGAGKSTLTQELGAALGSSTLVLMEPDEQGDANPYLADFYGDMDRWAFTMQVHLLGVRYRMQLMAQWHAMGGLGHAVCDRSYYGDTCFARMMRDTGQISAREFGTYQTLYQTMSAGVLLPSVCVRLHVDPAVAAGRIRKRAADRDGRKSELTIDLSYLRALDAEITSTVDVLRQQGVHVLDVDWGSERSTAENRASEIRRLADEIQATPVPDLFKLHRRVIA